MNSSMNNTTYIEEEISAQLWTYLGTLLIVVGTVCNILAILVLTASRSMRTQSSTIYLISMSIAGIISLYTGMLRQIVTIGITRFEFDFRNLHDNMCKAHTMFSYASLQFYAWLQATVAGDRLISVLLPHKYMTSCNWKVSLIVVLIELVLVLALNSPILVAMGLNEEGFCLPMATDFFLRKWPYIDFASFSGVPAVVMCVCNISILCLLKKNMMKPRNHSDVTVMLMSLNVFFIITTLPISVMFFLDWGQYPEKRYVVMELWWTVFSLIQYVGASCTFFIYCLTGSKFREELCRLCRCCIPKTRKRRSTQSGTATTNMQHRCQYNSLKVSSNPDLDDNTSMVSL